MPRSRNAKQHSELAEKFLSEDYVEKSKAESLIAIYKQLNTLTQVLESINSNIRRIEYKYDRTTSTNW